MGGFPECSIINIDVTLHLSSVVIDSCGTFTTFILLHFSLSLLCLSSSFFLFRSFLLYSSYPFPVLFHFSVFCTYVASHPFGDNEEAASGAKKW